MCWLRQLQGALRRNSRNEELSNVNSDLINLLATVDIFLNLIPGDVGRPVGLINTNLVAGNLERMTRETINTMLGDARYWAVLTFGVAHAETRS